MHGILKYPLTQLLPRLVSCVSHDGGSGKKCLDPLLANWETFHLVPPIFPSALVLSRSHALPDHPDPTSFSDSLTVNPAGQQVILFLFSMAFWYFPMIGLRPCAFSLETPEVTFSSWSLMLRHIAVVSMPLISRTAGWSLPAHCRIAGFLPRCVCDGELL